MSEVRFHFTRMTEKEERLKDLGRALQPKYDDLIKAGTFAQAAEGVNLENKFKTLSQKAKKALGDDDKVPTAEDVIKYCSKKGKVDPLLVMAFVNTFEKLNLPIVKAYVGDSNYQKVNIIQKLFKDKHLHRISPFWQRALSTSLWSGPIRHFYVDQKW